MRLNGWIRIAIVVSAIWMVCGTGYFYWQEQQRLTQYASQFWKTHSDCSSRNAARHVNGQTEVPCDVTVDIVKSAYDRRPDIWLDVGQSAFILVVAWILGGVVYAAVWWIRRGFRAHQTRP
jgi:hypothetical protein